jgi:hypothetical protein
MKESINLTKAESTIIYYALEEIAINRHPDDMPFGPSTEQLSNLLTKFEKLTNKIN